MNPPILRSGALAAFSAALFLALQVVIASGFGNDFVLLSSSVDPARMSAFFGAQARALTLLMTADDAFAIAYGVAFIALAAFAMPRLRMVGILALVLSVATTLTDLAENSLTLAGVQTVAQGQTLDANLLLILFWLGQMKYLAIYLAALLFAVGLWESERAGKILALLFLLFPVAGIAAIAIEALALVKLLLMFVLLITGGIFLWRQAGQPTSSG